MSKIEEFEREVAENIKGLAGDDELKKLAHRFNIASADHRYTYNFRSLGRPIIQFPQDIVATQELIWKVKPDLIIETGIAHGGSLMSSASILALLDYSDAVASGKLLDPQSPSRKVIAIDIDIREHNREQIEAHPMYSRIELIEGSSIDEKVIQQVKNIAKEYNTIMLCLDSNHTHEHVLAELEAYAPLVSPGSYCVVSDTIVEDAPEHLSSDRPWGKGNNPKTAVWEYLKNNAEFEIDKTIEDKLLITVAPDGYLLRK